MALDWGSGESQAKKLKTDLKPLSRRKTVTMLPMVNKTATTQENALNGKLARENAFSGKTMLPSVPAKRTSTGATLGNGNKTDTFAKRFALGSENIAAGMLGAAEGASDFVGTGVYKGIQGVTSAGGLLPNKVSEWAGEQAQKYLDNSVTEKYKQSIQERYNPTEWQNQIGNVEQTISAMLPSVAAAIFTGNPLVGKAMMGAQAAGQAASQASKEGASANRALAYGAAQGVLETAIEGISGGIPGLGKGVVGEAMHKIMKSPVAEKIIDIAGEGGEEALSTFLTPYFQRAIYNKDAKNATADELAQSAIMGIAAAGIMQAGIALPNYIGDKAAAKVQMLPSVDTPAETVQNGAGAVQGEAHATSPADAKTQTSETVEPAASISGASTAANIAESLNVGDKVTLPSGVEGTVTARDGGTVTFEFENGGKAYAKLDGSAGAGILDRINSGEIQVEKVQNESIGAADAGFDKVGALVDKYGAIPEGMNPAADRVVEIPQQTEDGTKVSRAARSAAEAQATPREFVPEIEQFVVDGKASYIPIENTDTQAKVTAQIEADGFQSALNKWYKDVGEGKASADIVATGATLYNAAVNAGDGKTALNILSEYIKTTRSTAQALQAAKILKTITPSGKLYMIEGTVANLNEKLGLDKNIQIDPTLADEYLHAPDDAARDAALDKIYQNVADQIPATFVEKLNAWRYLSMLGNLKTHERNIIGNAVFQPVRKAKDAVATIMETVASKATGGKFQRTKGFIADPALFKAAWDDYANVKDTALGQDKFNGNTRSQVDQEIQNRRAIFNNPVLETARKANSGALDFEDMVFNKATYTDALASFLAGNGITAEQMQNGTVDQAVLDRGRSYAIKEAQKATYRDSNQFSDYIAGLGKNRHSNNMFSKVGNAFVEGVLPFKRTPANILARAEEYSPLGLINTAVKAAQMKSGDVNVSGADVIDSLSSSLTGTGLFALGAWALANGLISGGADKDEKQAGFYKLQGKQNYALTLPNGTSITLDWLAPESIPFFMGAEMATQTLEDGFTADALWKAVNGVTAPMLEMSMLQGVSDMLDNIKYSENSLPSLVASSLFSLASQMVPTLTGQAERTAEDTRMTTYTDAKTGLPTGAQYALGKVSAKIPSLDFQQIPYIDAWGRTQKSGSAAENFLSPAYISQVNTTKTDEELQRLYDKTGENVFPATAAKSFSSGGETVSLSKDQYVTFAKKQGQTAYSTVSGIISDDQYKTLTDAEKAQAVGDAYIYAMSIAKMQASKDYEPAAWVKKAMQMTPAARSEYMLYRAIWSSQGDGSSKADQVQAVTSGHDFSDTVLLSGLTENQVKNYNTYAKGKVDAESYLLASAFHGSATTDRDANGKAIKGHGATDKTLAYIDKMKLTNAQKRALAESIGIAESTAAHKWPKYKD